MVGEPKNRSAIEFEKHNSIELTNQEEANISSGLLDILSIFENVQERGKILEIILKKGSDRIAARIPKAKIRDKPVFVKIYYTRPVREIIRCLLLKPSIAEREWSAWKLAWRIKLPIPQPYLLIGKRKFGIARWRAIVSEFKENYKNLESILSTKKNHFVDPNGFAEVEKCMLEVVGVVARMHSAGVVHGDLQPTNILVNSTEIDKPRIVLVDLSRLRETIDEGHLITDLVYFIASLFDHETGMQRLQSISLVKILRQYNLLRNGKLVEHIQKSDLDVILSSVLSKMKINRKGSVGSLILLEVKTGLESCTKT